MKISAHLALVGGLVLMPVVAPLRVPLRQTPSSQRVTRAQLLEAMSLQKGFDITATTNGARFQGGVILQLARWARERTPDGPPLFIDHEDSFEAYLRVARLTREQAPVFVRKAFEHRQAQLIEYRQDAVIAGVEAGPVPTLAVSVKASWPPTPDLPGSFSYVDTYSVPNLRVTNQRIVTYKLLDFGDFVLYDKITGVSGKPISGVLGLLFKFLGDSEVLQSRSAIASDGVQMVQAHAKWGVFSRNPIVTIQTSGKAEEGADRSRSELRQIEARLKQEIRIRYRQE